MKIKSPLSLKKLITIRKNRFFYNPLGFWISKYGKMGKLYFKQIQRLQGVKNDFN